MFFSCALALTQEMGLNAKSKTKQQHEKERLDDDDKTTVGLSTRRIKTKQKKTVLTPLSFDHSFCFLSLHSMIFFRGSDGTWIIFCSLASVSAKVCKLRIHASFHF